MLRLSLRSFRVKPVRSILTIFGMSIGFGVVLFLVSLGYGLQYILIGDLATTQDSLITMQASYPSEANLTFSLQTIDKLRALQGVSEVIPIADVSSGEVASAETKQTAIADIQIVDPGYFRLSGKTFTFGSAYASTTPGVVVTSQTLALLGISTSTSVLRSKVSLAISYSDFAHATTTYTSSIGELPIVGVMSDDSGMVQVFTAPSSVATQPTFYQTVLVKAKSIDTVELVRTNLTELGLIVSARIDLINQARQITNIITIVLGVFGITALVVSAIGMFNTMIVTFMERTYEVGVLKSLGATDTDVRNLFLLESAVMGFLGGVGGVALGFVSGQVINLILSVLVAHFGGKQFTLFITPLWFVGLTVGLSVAIGILSGLWPAYRASKLSAKEAFLQR